jgi:hypothetical protein
MLALDISLWMDNFYRSVSLELLAYPLIHLPFALINSSRVFQQVVGCLTRIEEPVRRAHPTTNGEELRRPHLSLARRKERDLSCE